MSKKIGVQAAGDGTFGIVKGYGTPKSATGVHCAIVSGIPTMMVDAESFGYSDKNGYESLTLKKATSSTLGGVKIGEGIAVDEAGTISATPDSELTEKVAQNTSAIASINEQAKGVSQTTTQSYGGGTIEIATAHVPLVGITFITIIVKNVTIANDTSVELFTLPSDMRPAYYLVELIDRDAGTGVTIHAEVSAANGKVFLVASSGASGSTGKFYTATRTVAIQHN